VLALYQYGRPDLLSKNLIHVGRPAAAMVPPAPLATTAKPLSTNQWNEWMMRQDFGCPLRLAVSVWVCGCVGVWVGFRQARDDGQVQREATAHSSALATT
jgi:hypothetical protein